MPKFMFLILLAVFLLSSCSSIPGISSGVEEDPKQVQKEISDGSNGTSETSEQLGTPFNGVDPMADIQLNAEIKKSYKDVAEFNRLKKYHDAIFLLNKIKGKYPQLSGPDYQKARIYLNQGSLDDALASIQLSFINNKRNYYALNLKGIILKEKGLFEEAKNVYLDAISIYPPYPNSHLNLGVLSDLFMGDLGLALIQYREYLRLTGNQDKSVTNWVVELERRINAGG